ncbi:MAG: Fe-S cluster assembly protein SufD [Gammaproteobacteria bacterium]|nr:Fe-S cluster assembly protein SufD [Gammaproteobacteria bacterium]
MSSPALDTVFPSTRHEDWKYTDLAPVIDISNRWIEAGANSADVSLPAGSPLETIDADWLVIANGRIDGESLARLALEGVELSHLGDVGSRSMIQWPLLGFNDSLLEDGLRIRVSAKTKKPIGVLLIDSADAQPIVSQARIDVDVEAGASAGFLEYHLSHGDADHYSNVVVNLNVADGARADYVRVQDRARNHCQTARLSVTLGRDAVLSHHGFDLGGKLVRNDLHIDIAAPGSEAAFDGLYIAGDDQHIDNHTRVDHRVGPAVSRQEYRGILKGKARCVWNGKAIVHEGADGTDADQANHNLLLSDEAEINAKPELEIYTDDVKCSHGTTVGQLDKTALFYLRSRGLDELQATRILTHAFAAGIVARVANESLAGLLSSKVEQRLGDLAESG